ncbi:MAG: FkbM family methyltransferase [Bacteroidetes bacterium]|nr:FkbM family methyltransferase [Bacteroidota bacterium]
MHFSFSRIAHLIDQYGLRYGIIIYLKLKLNRLHKIRIPGIFYPICLRKNTTDKAVFDQVFLSQEYHFNVPFTPQVIVDAGANIGLFSILMKNKFPSATIISIEPDKENFEFMKKNLHAYPDIKFVHAGVWSEDALLAMIDDKDRGKSGVMLKKDMETGTIQGYSIQSIMSKFNVDKIDILKIDIECSEKELFAHHYEAWLSKTKMIVIELHDWLCPGCGEIFFRAIQRMIPNYRYSICGENTIIENLDLMDS